MFFYLLLFLVSTFLVHFGSRCKKSQRFLLVAIGIMLPVMVATLRGPNVGKDTLEYTSHFDSFMAANGFSAVLTVISTEFFFVISCYIAKFTLGLPVVFFCYSFLTILFAYLAVSKFKKSAPIWLGYLLFLFFFYNSSLNIMRQMLAVPYMLYVTSFLLEGKKKIFFVLTALSIIFHLTSVVAGGLIYVLYRISIIPKRKRQIIYMLFYAALFGGFLLVDILMKYLGSIGFGNSAAYTSDAGESLVGVTDLLYSMVLIFFSYIAMKRGWIERLNPNFFYLAAVTCIVLFMTGIYNPWLMRMAYYMMAFACIYLPIAVMSPRLRRYRSISKLALFFFGFAYWLYLFVISGSNQTIPYYTNDGVYFNF